MSKDPAFLFYSKDFYEGTRTMLPEERACYIDLLIYQHQHGVIPNDLKRVLMYCSGLDEATLKATLQAKFKQTESGWLNTRLSITIEERKEYASKQSNNGKVGQVMKKAKSMCSVKDFNTFKDYFYNDLGKEQAMELLENEETTLEAMLKGSLKHLVIEDVIVNEDVNINKDKEDVFKTWLKYRVQIKKTIKANKTLEALAIKFNEHDLNKCTQVVNASIENGWQGLFWDKQFKEDISKQDTRPYLKGGSIPMTSF
jgi:uncharacterized protein YdaU (DUF1376 family)